MRAKHWKTVIYAFAMIVLILDSRTALSGGSEGLRICLMSVVPALLPFLVLSVLLTATLSPGHSGILRPLGRFCKMPPGSEGLLLLGLLGGYPSGAQAVTQAYHGGSLSREDARRLLGFCSNAGPAFLFGIAAGAFPSAWMPWAIWAVHILSAVVTGALLPGGALSSAAHIAPKPISLSRAVEQALGILARVCAWIILFRVLIAFFDRWFFWLLPENLRVLLCGILELANGCLQLSRVTDLHLRFILTSFFLSTGGICVTMQTLSVTGDLGLGSYLPGKCLQGVVAVVLSLVIFHPLRLLPGGILMLSAIILLKIKKSSGNSRKLIV